MLPDLAVGKGVARSAVVDWPPSALCLQLGVSADIAGLLLAVHGAALWAVWVSAVPKFGALLVCGALLLNVVHAITVHALRLHRQSVVAIRMTDGEWAIERREGRIDTVVRVRYAASGRWFTRLDVVTGHGVQRILIGHDSLSPRICSRLRVLVRRANDHE